jgi:hypothetical protein
MQSYSGIFAGASSLVALVRWLFSHHHAAAAAPPPLCFDDLGEAELGGQAVIGLLCIKIRPCRGTWNGLFGLKYLAR